MFAKAGKLKRENIVTIEAVGRKGDGIAALDDGRKVFVPRTVPGDKVKIKIKGERGEAFYADLLEVIEPGTGRTSPPCQYYSLCGGCSLQHFDEQEYKNWKVAIVEETLERAGIRPGIFENPVFIPPGARRRATFAAFKQNKNLRLGYRRQRSHEIIDVSECMVLSPALAKFAIEIRPYLLRLLTDSRPADIFVQEAAGLIDVLVTGPVGKNRKLELAEREIIAEMVHDLDLARFSWRAKDRDDPEIIVERCPFIKTSGKLAVKLPPGAFLQPSAVGEGALVSSVMAALSTKDKLVSADLFAGCGTFTGHLLEKGQVTAYEGDRLATDNLHHAAKYVNGLTVETRDLFRDPLTPGELKAFDVVVLDPPRAGAKEQARELASSSVETLIYVSCNPATFVRDAKVLLEGNYRLERLSLVDQFVFSSHVEVIGKFSKS